MPYGYGMQGFATVQAQSAMGTAATNCVINHPFLTENIAVKRDQLVEGGMRNRFVENPYSHGKYTVGGQITIEANPLAMIPYIFSAFGRMVSEASANVGSVTHTFIPDCTDLSDRAALRPLTIQLDRNVTSAFQYSDMFVNQLTFNFPQGQFMSMAVDLIGGNWSGIAAVTPTFDTQAPFRWDQTSLSFAGASVVDIEDLTIRYSNNLETQWVLVNCATPYRVKRTAPYKVDVDGTMTFAASWWNTFMSGSQGIFFANLAGTAPYQMLFHLPNFRFYALDPNVSGAGLVKARFTGGAQYYSATSQAIQITMVTCRPFFY